MYIYFTYPSPGDIMVFKIGTLFSGIGAPEVAINNLRIDHSIEYACDNSEYAMQTYKANHSAKYYYDDVCEMTETTHKIDLLVYGFPCQPFSVAGRRNGSNDKRGKLIFAAIKILNKHLPKFFIAENVPGLLHHRQDMKDILSAMRVNYDVQYATLNSLDFGVPQRRRRLWFVGIRKDLKASFDFTKLHHRTRPLLRDVLESTDDKRYYARPILLEKEKFKHALDIAKGDIISCITHTIARDGSSREYMSYVAAVHNAIGEMRKPTPEECLRLFGFPKSFKFPANLYDTRKYEQVGNTMVVPCLEEIIQELIKI